MRADGDSCLGSESESEDKNKLLATIKLTTHVVHSNGRVCVPLLLDPSALVDAAQRQQLCGDMYGSSAGILLRGCFVDSADAPLEMNREVGITFRHNTSSRLLVECHPLTPRTMHVVVAAAGQGDRVLHRSPPSL